MTPADEYARRGFVTGIRALDDDEVLEARQTYERLEAGIGKERAQIGLTSQHLTDPGVWALAAHPKILDAVESVAGSDVVLIGTHFFSKQPARDVSVEGFVAWHQDVTYWGLRPRKAITAWLAVDDADVENGCMRVIEGSHVVGQVEHGESDREGNLLSVNQAIDPARVDESKAVDLELQAGCISVHDGLLIHGSNPNRSTRRRCGLTIRYTTPEVRLVGDDKQRVTWHPILMRGEDHYGHLALEEPPAFVDAR
ncbi:MAG: phytanoyl-CoA dioxygenase family protein [Phycisphaeraceae bacterium]|nr:phytanoyl-CoA dioxygenase family protein [Phycisphaeraceae bacterium]